MRRRLLLLLCVLSIAGCVSMPFQKTADVSVAATDPNAVVEKFREASPETFQLLKTITFQYGFLTFSGLGFAEVDTKEKTFSVVCMNHMGVKLFEVYGNKEEIKAPFVMDELKRGGNIALAVGEDIKRVYFDLIPSAEAKVEKEKYRILFSQPSGRGVLELVFAGTGLNLVEKTYYEDGRPIWSVSYYEYQQKKGKFYPGGIVLENYKYSYKLIIRLKEIYS